MLVPCFGQLSFFKRHCCPSMLALPLHRPFVPASAEACPSLIAEDYEPRKDLFSEVQKNHMYFL
jgi:hypothetical protein